MNHFHLRIGEIVLITSVNFILDGRSLYGPLPPHALYVAFWYYNYNVCRVDLRNKSAGGVQSITVSRYNYIIVALHFDL